MSNIDNKDMNNKELTQDEIKKQKHREAQRNYYKKQKEKLNDPNCETELKDKYEKVKKYKNDKFKEYYEQNKDVINEKALDKYHEKKENDGKKTKRTMEIPKTKEDKFELILQLLPDIEMSNDNIKKIKEKMNIK